MQIFKLASDAPDYKAGCVLTIGNFDGVHLGHQSMLGYLLNIARPKSAAVMVMLFEPQPKEYLNRETKPVRLFSLREKLWALQRLGVHYVACVSFDSVFSKTTPVLFFTEYVLKKCHASHVVVGEDFYFGYGRQGSAQCMQVMALNAGIPFDIYNIHRVNELKISSTLVRDHLSKGLFDAVEKCLGQPYFIIGRVGYGQQLGRQLGVPTANIALRHHQSTLNGVFCVRIVNCRTKQQWYGVANIGFKPTLGGNKRMLEAHLFDFQGSLYGEFLQVFFMHKLRSEKKFSSIEELKKQIHQDICMAKQLCEH